jgi:hypothetical protein
MTAQSVSRVVLLALVLSLPHAARAQGGGAVYVVQFRDLKAQLNALAERADRLAANGTSDQKQLFALDALALTKLIHKLGEDAGDSNVIGLQQGRRDDTRLLLVAVGVEALSLESGSLDAFVNTGDRSFKAAARDADAIAANLAKAM